MAVKSAQQCGCALARPARAESNLCNLEARLFGKMAESFRRIALAHVAPILNFTEWTSVPIAHRYILLTRCSENERTACSEHTRQGMHDLRVIQDVLDSFETGCNIEALFKIIPIRESANILYFETRIASE